MPPLLDICDLYTWFAIRKGILSRTVGHVRAVDGVSLTVDAGETVGLVGESGCGKTTLARTVVRLEPARSGAVLFEGRDLLKLPESQMRPIRPRLQIVFQDPFASLNPRLTVMEIIAEGLIEHGIAARRAREAEARRLLEEVGLGPESLHRYPHEFSGGQRQRISIARAVALRPRLVICDEAVSALDVSVQAQILNLLMDLREKHQLAYLFISHDLRVVRHIAHRTAVMYLGQIVEQGDTAGVIDAPCHPYTRALVSAIPQVGGDRQGRIVLPGDVPSPAHPPAGCRFHPRCSYAIPACREHVPPLEPFAGSRTPRLVACIRKNDIR